LCISSVASAATYDPILDGYSMKAMTENIGAPAFWDAGLTGAGIDVAMVDTGVAPVEGLPPRQDHQRSGSLARISGFEPANLDTNGHGTFIAGLIAGKDSILQQPYSKAPPAYIEESLRTLASSVSKSEPPMEASMSPR
jgi:subtilisin family serine protease